MTHCQTKGKTSTHPPLSSNLSSTLLRFKLLQPNSLVIPDIDAVPSSSPSMDVNTVDRSSMKETEDPTSSAPSNIVTQVPRFPSYLTHYNVLLEHIQSSKSIDDQALELLRTLQTDWPHAPPHEILLGDPWDFSKPIIRTNSHPTNDFGAALTNITDTGRILSKTEQNYLRLLLSYWQGWSATHPQHKNDPCFRYIQWRFRHVGHLHPILDNAWWPEDVALLPQDISASLPSHFLLATREFYYVYVTEVDELYRAGKALEDVFIGLKEGRDKGTPEVRSWEYEDPLEGDQDSFRYFPNWSFRSSGFNEPFGKVEVFIPPSDL
jgi:hypothetical protein